jgi:hypothetical protein
MNNNTPQQETPKQMDELIDKLNQKTTAESGSYTFEQPTGSGASPADQSPAPGPNPDDFAPPPPPGSEPKPAATPITPEKAKAMAKTWTKWFNGAIKWSFPWFYRKTILQKGDQEKMTAFISENRGLSENELNAAINVSHELYPVKNRIERYLDAKEGLAFTEEEIGFIAEPLSDLIIKYKHLQLTPEWSLVIAVCIVMAPRFEPMMPDMGRIFSSAQKKAEGK